VPPRSNIPRLTDIVEAIELNVLRHNYQSIAAPVMWTLVRNDLHPLENVCRNELAAAIAREAPPQQ
jgi:hypothetical protein